MIPKWITLLAALLILSASADSQFSSEEETSSDDWIVWTLPESNEEREALPLDVTTTDVLFTETITAVTDTETTTLPATTSTKAPTSSTVTTTAPTLSIVTTTAPTSSIVTTTAPPEEEELTTTEIITTTKRSRSKSTTTTTTTTSTTTPTTTTTTTTEFNPLSGGLSEFLKRRRIERIMATTEVDPFIAILATATPPSSTSVEQFTESPSESSSSSSSFRFATRRKNQNRKTTPAPVVRTPDPIDVPAIRLISNRLNNNQLKRKTFGRTSTSATPSARTTVSDFRSPSTSTSRSRFTPKRNRANARKEVTTTVSPFGEETTITETPERSSRLSTRRTSGFRLKVNRI